MRKVALILALLVSTPAMADALIDRQEQMVYPTVIIEAGKGTGSGTVIWSGEYKGEIHTYILTNDHVVKGAEYQKQEYKDGEYADKLQIGTVRAVFQDYQDNGSRSIGTITRPADVVLRDVNKDLALLRLRDDVNVYPHVACLAPKDSEYRIGEEVWAVGAGLGYPVQMTTGYLGLKEQYNSTYPALLLNTANIIWGNSGGGLYREGETCDYELVGVPSLVAGVFPGIPITHLGFAVPSNEIRDWIHADYKLRFIIGETHAPEYDPNAITPVDASSEEE